MVEEPLGLDVLSSVSELAGRHSRSHQTYNIRTSATELRTLLSSLRARA